MHVLDETQWETVSGGDLVEWPIPGQEPSGWAQWNEAQRQAFLRWLESQATVHP